MFNYFGGITKDVNMHVILFRGEEVIVHMYI